MSFFIDVLKSVRTLLAYVITGLFVCIPFLVLLPFIGRKGYAFEVWLAIDVFICTIAHGTRYRTISGWTGQHMLTHNRYYLQAIIIDWLLQKLGDAPNHCLRAYQHEKAKGLVN